MILSDGPRDAALVVSAWTALEFEEREREGGGSNVGLVVGGASVKLVAVTKGR